MRADCHRKVNHQIRLRRLSAGYGLSYVYSGKGVGKYPLAKTLWRGAKEQGSSNDILLATRYAGTTRRM